MDILNRTPFKFAYLPHRKNYPGHTLSLIVKGTFRLLPGAEVELLEEQPSPTGDEPYPDDEEGEGAPRYENDFAPFKPRTDLLLVGSCHPPGGPTAASRATFRVGPYQKVVGVIGNRQWKGMLGGKTSPEPFAQMEVRYENAYGGPGSKKNPVGKGSGKSEGEDGSKAHYLPNIEDPTQLINSNRDKPDPVGFGPLGRMWEDRFRKVGSYKGDWLKKRFPAFPEDFDWGHFNCAPMDLQPPYIKGDEDLFMENLHPSHSSYTSKLPGFRIRAFVQEKASNGQEPPFREVPMNLDTLWVDMDEENLVLVWRGLTVVQSEEFKEISEILVVSERLTEPLTPTAELQALIPEMLEEVYGDLDEEPPPPLWEDVPSVGSPSAPSPVGGATASVDGETEFPDEATPVRPKVESRDALEALLAKGDSAAGLDLRGLDLSGLSAPESDFRNANLEGVGLAGADLSGALFSGAKLDGANLSKAKLGASNFVAATLRQANLTSADVQEADFRKADLVGATLTSALAEGAVFDEANLEGARLDEIQAESASFESANLRGAFLQMGNFKSADFSKALLRGAKCHRAVLEDANWSKARAAEVILDEAELKGFRAVSGCDLSGASVKQAKGERSIWAGARLDGSDFSYAEMEGANFTGASLVGAKFNCADMPHGKFAKADLTRAELKTMNLFQGTMEKANLTGANLSGSNMYGVQFLDSTFSSTVGEGTNLKMTLQDPGRR